MQRYGLTNRIAFSTSYSRIARKHFSIKLGLAHPGVTWTLVYLIHHLPRPVTGSSLRAHAEDAEDIHTSSDQSIAEYLDYGVVMMNSSHFYIVSKLLFLPLTRIGFLSCRPSKLADFYA